MTLASDDFAPLAENICLSGGAIGADLMWGMVAGSAGHTVVHWSFNEHKSNAPTSEIVTLTKAQLRLADQHCALAAPSLNRPWPPRRAYVQNLLRRNWYQVETAQSCYAVSSFKLNPTQRIAIGEAIPGAMVQGGTAWAVQMFIDKHNGQACPCYVFDHSCCYWFEWTGVWTRIYEPPRPHGIWAGIGTRKLDKIGRLAIRVLLGYQQDFHSEKYPMLRVARNT